MDLLGKNLFIQACVWPNSIMLHILDFFKNSEEVAKNNIKIFQVFKAKEGSFIKNKIVITVKISMAFILGWIYALSSL